MLPLWGWPCYILLCHLIFTYSLSIGSDTFFSPPGREAVNAKSVIDSASQECTPDLSVQSSAAPVAESTRLSAPGQHSAEVILEENSQASQQMEMNIFSEVPQPVDESELLDPTPQLRQNFNDTLSYEIVLGSSTRGRKKLIDSARHAYTVKRETHMLTSWRCVVRNKTINCKATVRQVGTEFIRGAINHCHPPSSGAAIASKVSSQIKRKALEDVFRPAAEIVEEALLQHVDDTAAVTLPAPHNLARQGNRKRQKCRPAEPVDILFEIAEYHIPDDFLRRDIKVGDRRHVIFATKHQLRLLSKANRWYADATFKVVKKPFSQLFAIHAFIRVEENLKQVPLFFALMSSKRKRDYKKVLRAAKELVPQEVRVKEIVVDLEIAMWQAITVALGPHVKIFGCNFHWGQAVMRHVDHLGLRVSYREDDGTRKFIRKILVLPYIPATEITSQFNCLQNNVESEQLHQLLDYVRTTCIDSTVWGPCNLSVYGQSVRTNNDAEGWHNRFNRKAKKGKLNFYMLVELMHQEARMVSLQAKALSDGRVLRRQRKNYVRHQGRIANLWEKYQNGEKTAWELSGAMSHIIHDYD